MAGGSEYPRGCAMSGTDIAQSPERRSVGARQLTLVLQVDSWFAFARSTAIGINIMSIGIE
eukprot:3477657-Pleurochrysis_carterae.AAC.2